MAGCFISFSATAGNGITEITSECSYNVFPPGFAFASGGGTGNINVETQIDCSWTAVTVDLNVGGGCCEADWINFTSDSSGTGSGTVSFSVDHNENVESRQGSINIAGHVCSVTQGANVILPCPLAYIVLQDDISSLELLRSYRDEYLSKTDKGEIFTGLYYITSEKAIEVMNNDPDLISEAKRLFYDNKDAIYDVLAGYEGIIYNTDEIISFMNNYAKESPLLLKAILNIIKKDILKQKREGELFLGFRLE